ncbi:MAG: GNAT family N-acetyltransferase [Clostridiaceae bacterium]|nr:GNAT family N-acetyltransferase [Eubacteriales bacterium]
MVTPDAYLRDPCGAAALAFWKENAARVPEHMRVVHERDFGPSYLAEYDDEPYFKLLHGLANIGEPVFPRGFSLRAAELPGDAEALAALLCACYAESFFTAEDVLGFAASPAHAPELWLLAFDTAGALCGAALADYDARLNEGVLEWIQVLPSYRGRGVGKALVNVLLRGLRAHGARFATVSGRINEPTRPEALYRACGFTGGDVWHVLKKKEERL